VELKNPNGFGRVRLQPLDDASAASLRPFLMATIELGSTVVTDGWTSYPPATRGL
jgi:hypothetical protein